MRLTCQHCRIAHNIDRMDPAEVRRLVEGGPCPSEGCAGQEVPTEAPVSRRPGSERKRKQMVFEGLEG